MKPSELNVLVVEDDEFQRRMSVNMLRSIGVAWATGASNGREALEAIRVANGNPVHIALCDLNMPEMDGITCLRALRAMDIVPRPVIVLCTTENSLAKIHEALTAGADEYIMKPFDREILHDKLEQLGLCDADVV